MVELAALPAGRHARSRSSGQQHCPPARWSACSRSCCPLPPACRVVLAVELAAGGVVGVLVVELVACLPASWVERIGVRLVELAGGGMARSCA